MLGGVLLKAVAIIPARGGSVRIPRKNIKPFHGKPMLEYAIEKAQSSLLFDEVIVSSDDYQITDLAEWLHCTAHHRNPDDGTRGTQEVAKEVLLWMRNTPMVTCVLYPCVPLLSVSELINGYRALLATGQNYAVSVNGMGEDVGAFYYGFTHHFLAETPLDGFRGLYVKQHFDINTPEDWARAEEAYAAA